ncbi:alpha-1B adrenergic receptor [Elysia marginata]|uniref:Alpha-1B adrenergic receptor n=1 Tax=Elysia marginata TaxID=1093978 RepID=A0AAV4FF61_9GAST|nr:alpha-1B adrenergic receptor [Elysia marginata]
MTLGAAFTVALFVVCVVFTVCVLVINTLTIVVIVRTRSVRLSNSNTFILNLAIIDILMMGPQLFFGTSVLREKISTLGLIFNAACYFTLAMAAMLNTFAIAVDRFLFIKRAMTYPSIVTSSRVRVAVLIIWVLAIIVGTISLYDFPFHQVAGEGVYQIHPDCQNATVQWLETTNFQVSGNISIYLQKIGLTDEADIRVLLHQIASCPQSARPALRIQNMILFTAFCAMGAASVILYVQVFFVIRNHNKNLAAHANFPKPDNSEYDSSIYKVCNWCEKRILSTTRRVKNSSRPSVLDTSMCLKVFSQDKDKTCDGKSDMVSGNTASSFANHLSSNRQSQISSSTASLQFPSTYSKDGEQKTTHDGNYDSDSSFRKDGLSVESKPAFSSRSLERTNRIKLSIRNRVQDMRTVQTLSAMFVIYYICWLPMIICNFTLYGLLHPITEQVLLGSWILGTSNSVWNFLVYPMRNRQLRAAITRLVCVHRLAKDKS